MDKRNSVQYQFKNIYQREKILNKYISKNENQILEEVNNIFIPQIIKELSNIINSNVTLIAHNMTIGFDCDNKNIIKPFMHCNILEILPCKNQFYVIFSPNMLFLMINIFFGGKNTYSSHVDNKLEMTSAEYFVNQKLIQLVIKVYSSSWKKFFLIHMKLIHVNKDIGVMEKNLNLNKLLIINHFIFNINNVEVYFYLLTPFSLLKLLNKNENVLSNTDVNIHKKSIQTLSIENMYDISLNIIARLASFSVAHSEIDQLSIGDILSIENPEKVILSIDKTAIFFGKYNIFDGKSAILIKELINYNIDVDSEHKENINESNAENI